MSGWCHISEAQNLRYGTVADLKMPSGRIYRATWDYRGSGFCAWWPDDRRRKAPIGLYNPVLFRIVATGSIPAGDWAAGSARAKRIAELARG